MIETSVLWLTVSILYLGTAIYLHLAHREVLPASIPFAFLCLGAGIFTAVNRSTYFQDEVYILAAEVVAIGLLVMAWAMSVWAVYGYLHLRHEESNS